MKTVLFLIALIGVNAGCSSTHSKFGVDLSQVDSVRITQIDTGKNWNLGRHQAQPLLDQIGRAQEAYKLLVVEYKYEIRLNVAGNKVVTLKASDHTVALSTNNDFYQFTGNFDLEDFLHGLVAG